MFLTYVHRHLPISISGVLCLHPLQPRRLATTLTLTTTDRTALRAELGTGTAATPARPPPARRGPVHGPRPVPGTRLARRRPCR